MSNKVLRNMAVSVKLMYIDNSVISYKTDQKCSQSSENRDTVGKNGSREEGLYISIFSVLDPKSGSW